MFLPLLLAALCLASASQAAAAPAFANISSSAIPAGTASPRKYEVFEVRFNITGYNSAERFNPEAVNVTATFNLPGGGTETVPAFYKQDASPNWAVRYAPRLSGAFTYTLKIIDSVNGTTTSAQQSFTTQNVNFNAGFLSVDTAAPANSKRFKTTNNDAFVVNGTNVAWSECKTLGGAPNCYSGANLNNPAFWDIDYTTALNAMQTFKMNFGRMFVNLRWDVYGLEWAANNNQIWRGLQMNYGGIGNYNLGNAARLDVVAQNAQSRGIYLAWVMRDHLEFMVSGGNGWSFSAYNSANGGPCATPQCFITDRSDTSDTLTEKFFKRMLRYHAARWGAYTSMGAMELLNEGDNGGPNGNEAFINVPVATWNAWHQEMNAYWNSLDIYQRPTTTSFAWRDHFYEDGNVYNSSWSALPFHTTRNTHIYNEASDVVDKWLTQINWLSTGTTQTPMTAKPAYLGEFGPAFGEPATPTDPNEKLRHEFFYHDGAWVPFFFAQAAGSNLIWKVDGLSAHNPFWGFAPHDPSGKAYKAFGNFMATEANQLRTMSFMTPPASGVIRVNGYKKANRALLLMRDWSAIWNNAAPANVTGQSVTLTGMTNGSYTLEFWDTRAGTKTTASATASGGSLVITVPSFQRSVAIKAILGGGPPPPTTVTPWRTLQDGSLFTNKTDRQNWVMGYDFQPLANGNITQLAGYFNNTKTVLLYNSAGAVLAQCNIAGNNTWRTCNITAVPVTSGSTYTVAVYDSAGNGVSARYATSPFPRTANSLLTITRSVWGTDSNPGDGIARPTFANTDNRMEGQPDVTFVTP